MSEDSKPVIIPEKTQRLRDIIEETEKQFNHEVTITAGEAKRIELIRKMKNDTDKKEYMIMFNGLLSATVIVSAAHFFLFNDIFSIGFSIAAVVYYLIVRYRLKNATVVLADHKNNFDKYLWEGFYLKEMRYAAVKLAFFIFFPVLVVFLTDLMSVGQERIALWLGLLIAFFISSIAWLIYFSDDKVMLENIESDLKSLQYL